MPEDRISRETPETPETPETQGLRELREPPPVGGGDVAVIIPAKDEQDRIAATVQAAQQLPGVDLVFVVDDGSADATRRLAEGAGATVVRHARNRGKGAAMESGTRSAPRHGTCCSSTPIWPRPPRPPHRSSTRYGPARPT
jgi:hypothetical protein